MTKTEKSPLHASVRLQLATPRPLALIRGVQGWKQRRNYAVAAEETNKGVVGLEILGCGPFLMH